MYLQLLTVEEFLRPICDLNIFQIVKAVKNKTALFKKYGLDWQHFQNMLTLNTPLL